MRTGHKLEKGKTGKRTHYIRLKTCYADNNISDGAGDEVDEMRDIMPLGALNKVSRIDEKCCCLKLRKNP